MQKKKQKNTSRHNSWLRGLIIKKGGEDQGHEQMSSLSPFHFESVRGNKHDAPTCPWHALEVILQHGTLSSVADYWSP